MCIRDRSGALEYEDDEYSILKIVADNIDGGIYTIQDVYKRQDKMYEKNALNNFKDVLGKYCAINQFVELSKRCFLVEHQMCIRDRPRYRLRYFRQ